jgi:hypothetical protein
LRDQPYDYEKALAQAPPEKRGVVIFPTSPVFFRDRQRIADFALRRKIAWVFGFREWVDAGGLFSYGVVLPAGAPQNWLTRSRRERKSPTSRSSSRQNSN